MKIKFPCILITGATGFLGRLLLRELIKEKDICCVILLVREKDRAKTVLSQELSSGAAIQLIEANKLSREDAGTS